ncbi:MAG: threonine ammonia-lyase [Bacteroidetes bacterium]|nr:MAG: threonine ammonia-lyase [Bacteroidota bacterium]
MIAAADIVAASQRLKGIVQHTPLMQNPNLSREYKCQVFLKREDLQLVRSYKLRGAYNKMCLLSAKQKAQGVVCASAGNHAQGVAYSCLKLGILGEIYMPSTTPRQKIGQVRMFGGDKVQIVLTGDTYDDAYQAAMEAHRKSGKPFIHPFDDKDIIIGQGTVGQEILQDAPLHIDYVIVPVGGGGLAAGVGSYLSQLSPGTHLIGVEPTGAPSMKKSLEKGEIVNLPHINKFVDGASVRRVGKLTFEICKEMLEDVVLVPEGKVCSTILQLYNQEAIVAEPAGALSIAALDFLRPRIKGKTVVCILSGGNNDIMRMEEIKERSLLYEGLKHYFLIRFPQRAGALKEFLVEVLGPKDDITRFEYTKRNNRETGPALVGIELENKDDYKHLIQRMKKLHIQYQEINENPNLFNLLV